MKSFHFCGQQQTLGSFVLSDVSQTCVARGAKQVKRKQFYSTESWIIFEIQCLELHWISVVPGQARYDDIHEKLLIQETYILEPMKL